MPTLRQALHQALQDTHTDGELAETLLRSEALSEALRLAASNDDDLIAQLGYTKATLRAQLSKARRLPSSSFPLPALEGRWWLDSEIAAYRTDHARSTSTGVTTSRTGHAGGDATARTAGTGIVNRSTGTTGI